MKIVLTQPNYAWLGKRALQMPPYTLALLNACLKQEHDVQLFDPNYNNRTEKEVFQFFQEAQPGIVGVSSISTEYIKAAKLLTAIIKEASPNSIVIQGGIIPTVVIETAMRDPNVDYWIVGEGEFRLPRLLDELRKSQPDLSSIDGLAYWEDGVARINPPKGFIEDLDSVPFPDYGNLSFLDYGSRELKYALQVLPRKFPYAVTITSRGCPYRCIFCAASTVSGRKMRFRSAENVLNEIDMLYKAGIREIIFLDDHFLGDRKRAVEIMQGLIERKYDLTWKCGNLTIFCLDREILQLMKDSGCYQMTLSIESGNQYVLDKIIKKPVKLIKVPEILDEAKSLGFETVANFVFGFPGETWEQIRETFRFAESISVDLVNFHIATPLPKTELLKICLRDGYLPKDFDIEEGSTVGYTRGLTSTTEFTPSELEILRAFEWDRINFCTAERRQTIAKMQGISIPELEQWRINTRRRCGVNVVS
ncbi:MAG: B12-binding domain-containing radical SAM protein [Dehalococcoidia bacterium]|nr:B12-binding domain-containing radical SAM protein [Dehalococcoidia bacterium]